MAEEKTFNVKYAAIAMVLLFIVAVVIASIALAKSGNSSSGTYDAKGDDVSDVGTLTAKRGNVTNLVSDEAEIKDLTATNMVASNVIETKSLIASDAIESNSLNTTSVSANDLQITNSMKSGSAAVTTLSVGSLSTSYIFPTAKGTPSQILAVPATGNQLEFITSAATGGIAAPQTATENGLATFGASPTTLVSSTVTLTGTDMVGLDTLNGKNVTLLINEAADALPKPTSVAGGNGIAYMSSTDTIDTSQAKISPTGDLADVNSISGNGTTLQISTPDMVNTPSIELVTGGASTTSGGDIEISAVANSTVAGVGNVNITSGTKATIKLQTNMVQFESSQINFVPTNLGLLVNGHIPLATFHIYDYSADQTVVSIEAGEPGTRMLIGNISTQSLDIPGSVVNGPIPSVNYVLVIDQVMELVYTNKWCLVSTTASII